MYSVMVVDDESIERDYIKCIVLNYPEKFLLAGEAVNGEQAIRMAEIAKPDIIIMDICMPLLDGLQAARAIKTKNNSTIIILNSAYSEFEFAQKAIHFSLDAYLLKPASESEIIGTIEFLIEKTHHQVTRPRTEGGVSFPESYPYDLADRIAEAIKIGDPALLKSNVENFLTVLKGMGDRADGYRLFIINTIFMILRALDKLLPKEEKDTFRCEEYLCRVNEAYSSQQVYICAEGFFKNLVTLLKNNCTIMMDITSRLEKYIADHSGDRITLEKLAEVFHFSPAYLSRVFHQDKGCTITSYIQRERVENAKYLLANSRMSVNAIADKTGFGSIPHFNRVFKNLTG